MNYTKQTITVIIKGAQVQTPATVADVGLAYHPMGEGSSVYAVTHVASGLSISASTRKYFETRTQCEQFIERIADLTDWTVATPNLSLETKEAVQKVADEL